MGGGAFIAGSLGGVRSQVSANRSFLAEFKVFDLCRGLQPQATAGTGRQFGLITFAPGPITGMNWDFGYVLSNPMTSVVLSHCRSTSRSDAGLFMVDLMTNGCP
jgi:hypothetical protein